MQEPIQQAVNQPVIAAALVAAIYSLVEAIKWMAMKRNGGPPGGYAESDRQMATTIYKQHQVIDEDGTPLWYVPRSMIKLQAETNDELRKLNTTMEMFKCPYVAKKDKGGREA